MPRKIKVMLADRTILMNATSFDISEDGTLRVTKDSNLAAIFPRGMWLGVLYFDVETAG